MDPAQGRDNQSQPKSPSPPKTPQRPILAVVIPSSSGASSGPATAPAGSGSSHPNPEPRDPEVPATAFPLGQDRDDSFAFWRHPGIIGWILVGAYGVLITEQTGNSDVLNQQMRATEADTCSPHTLACPHGDKPSSNLKDLLSQERTHLMAAVNPAGPWPNARESLPRTIVKVKIRNSKALMSEPGTNKRDDSELHSFLVLFAGLTHVAALPIVRWTDINRWEGSDAWPIITHEEVDGLHMTLPRRGAMVMEPGYPESLWERARTRPLFFARLHRMALIPTSRFQIVVGRVTSESFATMLETLMETFPWP